MPAKALQAATVVPAAAAGCRYRLGQIAPTFWADLLLLLGANPRDGIRHLQQVLPVVLRGRVFDQATRQPLLDECCVAPPLKAKAAAAR